MARDINQVIELEIGQVGVIEVNFESFTFFSGTARPAWGSIEGTLSAQTDLQNALNGKVDKVTGKQLSTEDYTTVEKNKLAAINGTNTGDKANELIIGNDPKADYEGNDDTVIQAGWNQANTNTAIKETRLLAGDFTINTQLSSPGFSIPKRGSGAYYFSSSSGIARKPTRLLATSSLIGSSIMKANNSSEAAISDMTFYGGADGSATYQQVDGLRIRNSLQPQKQLQYSNLLFENLDYGLRADPTIVDSPTRSDIYDNDDSVFTNLMFRNCRVGWRIATSNTTFYSGIYGGCNSGVQVTNFSAVSFYGTTFTKGAIQVELINDNLLKRLNFDGVWFEGATESIVKRTVAPIGSDNINGITFKDCNFNNQVAANGGTYMMDLSNCGGTFIFQNCEFVAVDGASNKILTGPNTRIVLIGIKGGTLPVIEGTGTIARLNQDTLQSTGSRSITVADSGRTYFCRTNSQTITLPQAMVGTTFHFVVDSGVTLTIQRNGTGGNTIEGAIKLQNTSGQWSKCTVYAISTSTWVIKDIIGIWQGLTTGDALLYTRGYSGINTGDQDLSYLDKKTKITVGSANSDYPYSSYASSTVAIQAAVDYASSLPEGGEVVIDTSTTLVNNPSLYGGKAAVQLKSNVNITSLPGVLVTYESGNPANTNAKFSAFRTDSVIYNAYFHHLNFDGISPTTGNDNDEHHAIFIRNSYDFAVTDITGVNGASSIVRIRDNCYNFTVDNISSTSSDASVTISVGCKAFTCTNIYAKDTYAEGVFYADISDCVLSDHYLENTARQSFSINNDYTTLGGKNINVSNIITKRSQLQGMYITGCDDITFSNCINYDAKMDGALIYNSTNINGTIVSYNCNQIVRTDPTSQKSGIRVVSSRFVHLTNGVGVDNQTSTNQAPIRIVTASGTITTTNKDRTVRVNKTTPSPTSLILPAGSTLEENYHICITDTKGDSATNNITISTPDSKLINGASTAIINTNADSLCLRWNGTGWETAIATQYRGFDSTNDQIISDNIHLLGGRYEGGTSAAQVTLIGANSTAINVQGYNPRILTTRGNVSSTPQILLKNGDSQHLVLTADSVLQTLETTARPGQRLTLYFQQDGVGGRTLTLPINIVLTGGAFAINPAPNAITVLVLEFRSTAIGWYEVGRVSSTQVDTTSSQTITNKTIDLSNNIITGTTAQFNTALSDGNFATLAGTETLTNKTINGADNTLSNISQSSVTNLTTDLANKLNLPFYGAMNMDQAGGATPAGTGLTTMSASADTFVGLVGTAVAGPNLNSFSVSTGSTTTIPRLTYTGSATKLFLVTCTYSATTSESTGYYSFSLAKNGTRLTDNRSLNRGSANDFSGSITTIVSLAQNQYLELWGASNLTTGTNTVRLKGLNITAVAIN